MWKWSLALDQHKLDPEHHATQTVREFIMDQDVARRLFTEGASLVLLDVPEGTEFGIDYNCWTVGPKFKGVKMIPPGFHFVFYSAVNKEGQSAPRTVFFHFFKRQEVVVKCWNSMTEDITGEDVTSETIDRITSGLKDLDQYLGAYPYETLKKWVSLTSHISEELMGRLQPSSGRISSVTQVVCPEVPNTAADKPQSDEALEMDEVKESEESTDDSKCTPGGVFAGVGEFPPTPENRPDKPVLEKLKLNYKPDAALRFTEIPKQKYPDGASPAEISHHNMDWSYTLELMLTSEYKQNEKDILGELQFSFVCFLLGHVYDAFEHWKKLVNLLCSSEDALIAHTELFSSFISVLHFQLKEVPDDFFVDIVSRNNFLTVTLQTFFSSLESSNDRIDKNLVRRGLQFRESLTKRYKWDFSSEPDEYAPTVVDT